MLKAALCFLLPVCLYAQVTFSEVMYDPATSEYHDEFIELYNLSSETIDLQGWRIADSAAFDSLVSTGKGTMLAPGHFVVVLDGSYFGNSNTYDNVIPDSVLIVKIAGNSFGRNGLTNSSGKTLLLINSLGNTVDVYHYSIGNKSGYSDEKIILSAENDSSNWAPSFRYGGTPGWHNSASPYDVDLALNNDALRWDPSISISRGHAVTFELLISNSGLENFTFPVNINVFADVNKDSVFDANDKVLLQSTGEINLDSGEEYIKTFTYTFITAGRFSLVAEIMSSGDQNPLNNSLFADIVIVDNDARLTINEIKFLIQKNEPEWLELYNAGTTAVSLFSWAIADQKDTSRIDTSAIIQPKQYKILSRSMGLDSLYNVPDSLIIVLPDFPTLNNNGDMVYLLTPAGGWTEQVPYQNDWLEGESTQAPSLERINPQLDARIAANWGPCTDAQGATPGKQNSIFTNPDQELTTNVNISPNPFSPDGDGFEDYAIFSLKLPIESSRIKIEIFDILGHRIRTLLDNTFSGSQRSLVWDGRDNNHRLVHIGIYIVHLQILNDRQGVIKEINQSVVVAGKL